jgi:hypothetical protein
MAASLSAGHALPPRKNFWNSFKIEPEETPGHGADGRIQ